MGLKKNKLAVELAVTGIALVAAWLVMYAAFATPYPFYVVASGSMVPALEVNDILIVQGHETIDRVEVGDIIVFDRPDGADTVIVHRIDDIVSEDPRVLRTIGDANQISIPGTDYPITAEYYIGKVVYVIPQIGIVTQILAPPINYILIAVIVGVMIYKHRRDSRGPASADTDVGDLDDVPRDGEYSAPETGDTASPHDDVLKDATEPDNGTPDKGEQNPGKS